MIPRWLPLALALILLSPDILAAQTASKPAVQGYNPDAFSPNVAVATNYDKMYEDIEIMRRILGSKLQPLYPRVSVPNFTNNPFTSTAQTTDFLLYSMPFNNPNTGLAIKAAPNKTQGVEQPLVFSYPQSKDEVISSLEGVYLKGQGVVYTATLSSLQPSEKTGADNSLKALADSSFRDWTRGLPVRQDSEWESVRRQVRNEKDKPKKPEDSKPPTLSDVLLKALAENGHNFSQLGANESLTLVLTVHNAGAASTSAKSRGGSTKTDSKAAGSSSSDLRSQGRDFELLGELHLKQGKYDEAIETFHKALGRTENPKLQAELLRKLAQCHLMQGQDEKARNELDKAILILKKETAPKDKPAPAVKPADALPVKLIISAPKKLLDQVKEGKITFDEFRRQASVETLRFDDRR